MYDVHIYVCVYVPSFPYANLLEYSTPLYIKHSGGLTATFVAIFSPTPCQMVSQNQCSILLSLCNKLKYFKNQ